MPKKVDRRIGYTPRGFGNSCAPWREYIYDPFDQNIRQFLDPLDTRDVTMAGFALWGDLPANATSPCLEFLLDTDLQ